MQETRRRSTDPMLNAGYVAQFGCRSAEDCLDYVQKSLLYPEPGFDEKRRQFTSGGKYISYFYMNGTFYRYIGGNNGVQ